MYRYRDSALEMTLSLEQKFQLSSFIYLIFQIPLLPVVTVVCQSEPVGLD